jgi:hypothetical protein
MKRRAYQTIFESRVCGIPCNIGVTYVESSAGSYSYYADNPTDYYGCFEAEFEILDRNERRAEWLERKMTEEDNEKVQRDIERHYQGRHSYY